MTKAQTWPVAVTPLGRVNVGTLVWRRAGQLGVTVVVKATFAFSLVGPMSQIEPEELRRVEAHHADNPMRSVRASGDLAPFLRRADVLFTGHAYAPPGKEAERVLARLALRRGDVTLLDKTLEIIGDRAATGVIKPFTKLPLVYERAFGGIGFAANPMGVGLDGKQSPNVVYPRGARASEPAGYGPISWAWPVRKRLLGGPSRKPLDQRIAELPAELDDAYFQAAPEDQRVELLEGSETISLEGLNRSLPTLKNQLPGARALARARDGAGRMLALELVADTLIIDGDAERCSVVWRGNFGIPDDRAIEGLRLAAGIELPGKPLEWPDLGRIAGTPSAPPPPVVTDSAAAPKHSLTMSVDDGDIIEEHPAQAPAPAGRLPNLAGTMMMAEEPTELAARGRYHPAPRVIVAPLAGPAPPPPPPGGAFRPLPPATREENPFAGTMAIGAQEHADAAKAAATPFTGGARRAPPPAPASAEPIPGAPWAAAPELPVVRPRADLSGTLYDAEPEGVAPAPPPAPPPPPQAPLPAPVVVAAEPPSAPAPRDAAATAADPWRKDAPASPSEPKRPPEPPKPAVKSSLYRRFGKG